MTAPSRPKRRPLAFPWTALLLAFVAGAFLSQPARADALADIQKAGVLKVGVFEDFPPFASAGADMSLHGYDIDVANALAKALGVKVAAGRHHRPEPHPVSAGAQGRHRC